MSIELIVLGFILMAVCAGFATVFLRSFYNGKFIHALIFKGLASLCFVIFGAVNYFTTPPTPTTIIIFIGLCFGIVGDELIALCQIMPHRDKLAFLSGGICFLVGHLLYIVSLFLVRGVSWLTVIISALLIGTIVLTYEKRRKFLSGEMRIPLAGYLGVVVMVSAVAIGVFNSHFSSGVGLFALGGILFTVSDSILFAYKFGEKPRFLQNVALHVAYYLAQFAIAWSIPLLF